MCKQLGRIKNILDLKDKAMFMEKFYQNWSSLVQILSEQDREKFRDQFASLWGDDSMDYYNIFVYQLIPSSPIPSVENFLSLSNAQMEIEAVQPAYQRLLYDVRFVSSLNDDAFESMLRMGGLALDDVYQLFKPNLQKLSCETVTTWAHSAITEDLEMDKRSFFKLAVEELTKRKCKSWKPRIWCRVTNLSVTTLDNWRGNNKHFLAYVKILYTISPQFFDGRHALWSGQVFARCITLLFPIFQERLEGQATLPLIEIEDPHSKDYFFQSLDFFLQISGWQDGQALTSGHELIAEMSINVAQRSRPELFNLVAENEFNHILSLYLSVGPPMSQSELVSLFSQSIRGAESLCLVLKRCNGTLTLDDRMKVLIMNYRHHMLFAIINLYNQHKDRTTELPFPLEIPSEIFNLPTKDIVEIMRAMAFLFLNVPFPKSVTHVSGFDKTERMDRRDLKYLLNSWLDGQAHMKCTINVVE
jgi:hypothetical protein